MELIGLIGEAKDLASEVAIHLTTSLNDYYPDSAIKQKESFKDIKDSEIK
jgi:hypothetical protein